jgi:hypothetical protein
MLNVQNLVIKIHANIFLYVTLKPSSGADRLGVEVPTSRTHAQTHTQSDSSEREISPSLPTQQTTRQESGAVLGRYAACSGNFLPTFRDDLSVPSSGTIHCPETAVRNYK